MLLQQQHWPSSRLWAGFVLLFLLASAFVGSSRSIKDSDTDDNSVRLRREENLIDHTPWTRVLQTYTSPATIDGIQGIVVDYERLRRSADPDFATYLNTLATFNPANFWLREDELAFWINAYNALVVNQVVTNPCRVKFGKFCWPAKSIRALGGLSQNNWDVVAGTIGGKDYSLRQVRSVLNGFNDSRVWSCIVSSCVSCPSLLQTAYMPDLLEVQMNFSAADFLNNTGKGLRVDRANNLLTLSPIFKWHEKAILQQHGTLINYILTYIRTSQRIRQYLSRNATRLRVSYFGFKWEFNSLANSQLSTTSLW